MTNGQAFLSFLVECFNLAVDVGILLLLLDWRSKDLARGGWPGHKEKGGSE